MTENPQDAKQSPNPKSDSERWLEQFDAVRNKDLDNASIYSFEAPLNRGWMYTTSDGQDIAERSG